MSPGSDFQAIRSNLGGVGQWAEVVRVARWDRSGVRLGSQCAVCLTGLVSFLLDKKMRDMQKQFAKDKIETR